MLEHLRDEYSRKALITFGVVPPAPALLDDSTSPEQLAKEKNAQARSALSYAVASAHLSELSSTYSPLSACASWRARPGERRDECMYD